MPSEGEEFKRVDVKLSPKCEKDGVKNHASVLRECKALQLHFPPSLPPDYALFRESPCILALFPP